MKLKILIGISCLLLSVSCSKKEYTKFTYNQLPSDVKAKFQERYNYIDLTDSLNYIAPFVECHNLDKNCDCKIDSKGGLIRNPFFVLESCGKKSKISWEVLESVFIIKNDSIYYPYHTQKAIYNGKEFDQVVGGGTSNGKPRSFNIKIDTINFRAEKMDKSWW